MVRRLQLSFFFTQVFSTSLLDDALKVDLEWLGGQEAEMDQANLVHDLTVEFGGRNLKATYFLEGDAIHVMIGETPYRLRAGDMPAEVAVRSLLLEQLDAEAERPAPGNEQTRHLS